jgi:type I restriction enzyme R subunit
VEPEPKTERPERQPAEEQGKDAETAEEPGGTKEMLRIRLADGKEREIEHSAATLFLDQEGRMVSAAEYLHKT